MTEDEIRADERERCARLVPTSWLDPIMAGVKVPAGCPDIEDLCRRIADAIRTSGVAPIALAEPMDAWVAYAKRSGLLDANGEAPDRAKAQTAFYAYSAAWNEARTPGVAPCDGGKQG